MKKNTLSSWKRVQIGSVCHGIYDGLHATPKPASEGAIFLGIKNITEDGQLDLSEIRYIAEEDFAIWTKRAQPLPGDIVFVYEATLNRYAIIPKGFRGCLGRRLAVIKPNIEEVDNRFLFYYFFGEDWRRTIAKNILSGSTVDRIPISSFPTFEISLPPLSIQKKIADILSAYDDLIKNNTRRIKILEEMARLLYCEWFVNFRFPNHQKVPMVESELGLIPQGWEIKELSDIASVIDCLHSKKPQDIGEGYPLLQVWNIAEYGRLDLSKQYLISEEDYKKWISRIEVTTGDCVVTNVGRIGAVAQIPEGIKAAIGRNMTAIRCKEAFITPTFLIEYLLSPIGRREVELKTDSGTIMNSLNVKGIVKLRVITPPKNLVKNFEKIARPMRYRAELLMKQNTVLRKTRDLLLPKLISGEIDVESLDSATETDLKELAA
jgi:type I restriction enzyme S subunit